MWAGPGKLRADDPAVGDQLDPCANHKVSVGIGRIHRRLNAVLGGHSGGLRFSRGCFLGHRLGFWLRRRHRCGRWLFKGRLMQPHQTLQEGAGLHSGVIDGLEPLAQLGQQAGNGLVQALRFLAGQVGLGAPKQHRHQRQVATGVLILPISALEHLRQGDHIRPWAGGKIEHVGRHVLQIRQPADVGRSLFGQHFPLLRLEQGFLLRFLMGLDLLLLSLPGRLQGLEHGIKRPCIFDFVGSQVLHRSLHQAHETAEPRRCFCGERQAALRQLIQQTARGMGAIGEKTPIVCHQLFECGLQTLHSLLHGRQKASILGNVLHHAANHLNGHGRGLGGRLHRHGRVHHRSHTRAPPPRQRRRQRSCLAAAGEPSHQAFELGHVLDGLGRCTHRVVTTALRHGLGTRHNPTRRRHTPRRLQSHRLRRHGAICAWIKRISASQHLAQDAHRQQCFFCGWRHRRLQGIATPASGGPHATAIAGVAIVPHGRAHRVAIAGVPATIAGTHAGVGAGAAVATATTRVAAGRAEHRVAHGLNTMFAQAGSRFFVFIHQQLTQQVAHVLHPQLAHFGRYASVSHHLLESADIAFGAQRVALGLHTAQALCGTDEGVEFGQHRISGMQRRLLRLGQLHLRLHLVLIHEREFTEVHAGVLGRTAAFGSGTFGKNLQQGHGITLDQRSFMLVQQAQAVTDQIALLDIADDRLLTRQGPLRDLDQFLHQRLAAAHGVDDTGAENSSRTRSSLGHGGEESIGQQVSRCNAT